MNTLSSPAIGVCDSIFRTIFTNEEMRLIFIFSRSIYLTHCITEAQSFLGVLPQNAGNIIERDCTADKIDWDRLQKDTEIVGYPILGLVRQLDDMCPESGKYLHWGATTQDIMDTASVLQIKAGLELISQQLNAVRDILVEHIFNMPFPSPLATNAPVWLSALDRHAERLEQLRPRALLVQFGGAVGSLASLGTDDIGLKVRTKLAEDLGLYDPPISWHVARDGIAETISFLSIIGGTLGKIAYDILLLSSSEFGEVQEPFVPHRGASSTMPQKRNSISSEAILACSKLLRTHAATAQDAMVSDLERASGPWHLEWSCVPEAFCLASGALRQTEFVLGGLHVDTGRMIENLDMSKGLIVGEAVMMGLAPHFGRNAAHDIVYEACTTCFGSHKRLSEQLRLMPQVREKLSDEDIDKLCDPKNYLGSCAQMVDDVLKGRK
ncbi:L-Aspartase-like protein [Armillaria novae-zelandiae]|uniref:L-Aspartase-like protein n=1 Tax=Armillaria novae-zelandiae TaxID=153914 RepID=A0AA39NUJ9_9AGAR|nr:L-Aspartase-like protein [Armillaria novae-zelandiae]